MVSKQVRNYLERGNIRNAVNFPQVELPVSPTTINRLVVINKDVPNMIATITAVIGEEKLNIQSFSNESNGIIGYNIIDFEMKCPVHVSEKIKNLENVIRVRLLNFEKNLVSL